MGCTMTKALFILCYSYVVSLYGEYWMVIFVEVHISLAYFVL